MKQPVTVFWFRRDLRLVDNAGLFNALNSGHSVLPVFIFDRDILDRLPKVDSRVSFIHEQLVHIQKELKKVNSRIAVYYGKPSKVFKNLLSQFDIK